MASPLTADTIQIQVEQLTAEAKKLSSAGKDALALDTYRRAAELMPGAPWLQHRTAELARRLKQFESAALHYRRAGIAFIGAGFPKRALAPFRTAWALCVTALPANPSSFVNLTVDLVELQYSLGLPAEAALSVVNANEALRTKGCHETVPARADVVSSVHVLTTPGSDPAPPESGTKPSPQPEAASGFETPDRAQR